VQRKDVILFNNAGISSTSGEVPASVEEMASNAAAFIKALGFNPEYVKIAEPRLDEVSYQPHLIAAE
jgi:hypothetical protein